MLFSGRKKKLIAVQPAPTSEQRDAVKAQTIMRVAALLAQVHDWNNPPPGTPKFKAEKYSKELSHIMKKFEALEFSDICDTFIDQLPPSASSSYLGCALAIISNKTNGLIALGLDKNDISFIYKDLGIYDEGEQRGKIILLYKMLKENLEDTPRIQQFRHDGNVNAKPLSDMLKMLIKEKSEPSQNRRASPV